MNAHKNARTTPFGRAVMVRRVLEEGWSVTAVASALEVSTRTVRKWLARARSDGAAGLQNRSSAPHLVANKLPAPWVDMIVRLRRDYRMTAEDIAGRLHLPRSTVAGHLARRGLGRLAQLERASRCGDTIAHAPASSSTSIPEARPLRARGAPYHGRSSPRFGRRRLGVRPRGG